MIKLTHLAKAAGWAAKVGPADLSETLNELNLYKNTNLLVGFETSDDAGVFKIGDNKNLVQTVDFITPVVDEAYEFGQIAALNSLSDVYAMGGNPITALSVLMLNCDVDKAIIKEMMQGACDELGKVNCTLLGGHTVEDKELKFGFSVTGLVEDNKFYRNSTLRENDILIYTQSLGIGVVSTALKAELAQKEEILAVKSQMLLSNYKASLVMQQFDVSACTDITGFGLAGHGFEMAKSSSTSLKFNINDLHIMSSALHYANMGMVPGGAYSNKQFMQGVYDYLPEDKSLEILMFDPQTSGGLLMGVHEKDALKLLQSLKDEGYKDSAIIGSVHKFENKSIFFI